MGNEVSSSASEALLDGSHPRVKPIGCGVLFKDISGIVGEYLSDSSSDYAEATLSGVQPISICLSHDSDSPFDFYWPLGFLSPEHSWESQGAEVHKRFLITDRQRCLCFLNSENSNYCRFTVEVLLVQLSLTVSDFHNALDELRKTIEALQGHLNSVKRFVISVTDYASCCFSLKNLNGKTNGISRPLDHQQALFCILDDLGTCYRMNSTLTVRELTDFYLKGDFTPPSYQYLAKFVISLNRSHSRDVVRREDLLTVPHKIMWVTSLDSELDVIHMSPSYVQICHAVQLDVPWIKSEGQPNSLQSWKKVADFADNPSIERIVINFRSFNFPLKLPRPEMALTDISRRSALIELTLENIQRPFHLTHLNNGYFPQLVHLSVLGGDVMDHLDSHCVPSLKTLRIEARSYSEGARCKLNPFVQDRIQSLLLSGHPWQLVATCQRGGWSLASYTNSITNPQDEVKEGSPHSLPLIRELVLMIETSANAGEFLKKLQRNKPFKGKDGRPNDHLLVWAPTHVQKISMFCSAQMPVYFRIFEEIPEQTRILSDLTCHNVGIVLYSVALPHLQLLDVHGGAVDLHGTFPQLEKLCLKGTALHASSTEHFQTQLPMRSRSMNSRSHPEIKSDVSPERVVSSEIVAIPSLGDLDDLNDTRFASLKHVVLHNTTFKFLDPYPIYNISRLALTVNPFRLPNDWHNTVWLCESLEISVSSFSSKKRSTLALPALPRVKSLTVHADNNCRLFLDKEMLRLTECTIPSPRALTATFKCPALKRIRYTHPLSEREKQRCLNPATYLAMGANPKDVIFAADFQLHTMSWDKDVKEMTELPLDVPTRWNLKMLVMATILCFFVVRLIF